MTRIGILLVATFTLGLVAGGCRMAGIEGEDRIPTRSTETRLPTAEAIPEGTVLDVRLDQAIGTEVSRVGDTFTATLEGELTGPDGELLVPRGATVVGEVTALKVSEHVGD